MKRWIFPSKSAVLALLATLSCAVAIAQAPGSNPSQRLRGQIVSLDGTDLQLRADTGQSLKIKLISDYRVGAIARGDLSKIMVGTYVGVAAMPQPDGTLKAIDLRAFPDAMRGTGEGHHPMNAAGGTMTNATVATASADATMTNVTVGAADMNGTTRRITVKYRSGEKVVLLQPDTPVFMIEAGNKSMLVTGARVVVRVSAQADGSLQGDSVTVGVEGAVPPI